MGLAEKRLAKDKQDTVLPFHQQKVDEYVGKPVPIELDWASFSNSTEELSKVDYICEQIAQAFGSWCQDDLGREAVQNAVKKVLVRNVDDAAKRAVSFKDGVVEVLAHGKAEWTQDSIDSEALRTTVEKAL